MSDGAKCFVHVAPMKSEGEDSSGRPHQYLRVVAASLEEQAREQRRYLLSAEQHALDGRVSPTPST